MIVPGEKNNEYMGTKKIVIVDYGMGNLRSIRNAIELLGGSCIVSNSKEDIVNADGIIMPGMGTFDKAMHNLGALDLIDVLHKQVMVEKINYLGICLGMQLLVDVSEEGGMRKGLSWIPGQIKKMKFDVHNKVPHVGWNNIILRNGNSTIFENGRNNVFYFDHSYYLECPDQYVSAYFDYGTQYVASIQHENIFGTQFHPEKSNQEGFRVIRTFLELIERQ